MSFAYSSASHFIPCLPKFTWRVLAVGSIRVEAADKPTEVNLWQATNPKARDFRLVSIGAAYKKSRLESSGEGVYVAQGGQFLRRRLA